MGDGSNDQLLDSTTVRRGEGAQTPDLQGDGPCLVAFEQDGSRVHALPERGEVVVGRGSEADVRLVDPSVSRRHATIETADGEAWISDLGSQNGTLVNGEKIGARRALVTGDLVTLSEVTLVFRAAPTRPRAVVSFAELRARADEELARARRHGRPLSVAFASFAAPPAKREVEHLIHGALRRGDVAAWAGDDQLLVLLPETNGAASARVTDLLAARARTGCATFPADADKTDELLAAARASIATTPVVARPRVVGGRPVVIADPAMARVYALAERLAAATLPVLVWGETGTGKELVATALHALSPRSKGPFVTLNCAAVHDTLFESELFGHQKGAFTGATAAKQGLIERADGGTLFLDEVGDMPAATQAKLLRVLETKRTIRLGAVEDRAVDFRLVTATNRDLEDEVRAGRFRADLFFRVSGGVLRLPPLRERPTEIPLLAQALLDDACARLARKPMRLSRGAIEALEAHDWPGNVRELKNVVDYVAAAHAEDLVDAAHIAERLSPMADAEPEELRGAEAPPGEFRPISDELDQLEARRMREALEASGGNITKAALLIGMPNRTFFKRMKKHALTRDRK